MAELADGLGLKGNPFEHYTAETEPHIAEYAVKPPYLAAIAKRARSPSSFILFGDRGAGKSATRITLYKDLWAMKPAEDIAGRPVPFPVYLVDFSRVLNHLKKRSLTENHLISETAFVVLEAILAWLASLPDDEREALTNALDKHQNALMVALLQTFYLSIPELERKQSEGSALRLLNQAWQTKSPLWIGKRWGALAGVIGGVVQAFTTKEIGDGGNLAKPVADFLKGQHTRDGGGGRVVLERLVEVIRILGFSGIVLLVDKVDETLLTANSAEATTSLIHPILSHVQLMEVDGFGWQFFLWSQTKPYMDSDRFAVRLDKIANAAISWDERFFRQMLDERVLFFSEGRLRFSDLLTEPEEVEKIVSELVYTSAKSPRELVRLMDTIVREHDISHVSGSETALLGDESISKGQDIYAKERVTATYNDRVLAQIFRLPSAKFLNKDVQTTFRTNPNSARNRIKVWEDAGIVKMTGTRAAEGDFGGKPAHEYSVIDSRVERIMKRNLIVVDDNDLVLDDEQDE